MFLIYAAWLEEGEEVKPFIASGEKLPLDTHLTLTHWLPLLKSSWQNSGTPYAPANNLPMPAEVAQNLFWLNSALKLNGLK